MKADKIVLKLTFDLTVDGNKASELPAPEIHYLNAATGWLELGNPKEASLELQQIRPKFRAHPDVLELRCRIYAALLDWQHCLETAVALTERYPSRLAPWLHLGGSLYHLDRHQRAYEILLPLAHKFPRSPELFYMLGVLAWSLRDTAAARNWLFLSFDAGGEEIKKRARKDKALENFWTEVPAAH